jgi:two-component system chemotaxis sensor kinase CheA
MNLDSALQTFVLESRELLEEMEGALLAAEGAPGGEEVVHAVFRAAHTIKGSAGLFGLDHIVSFTHVVESLLDQVRDGTIAIDGQMIALFLSCCDHIGALVDAVESTGGAVPPGDDALLQAGEPLLAQLRRYMNRSGYGTEVPSAVVEAQPAVERIEGAGGDGDNWHISLRFGTDVLRNGMDPLSFLRYLRKIGSIVGIVTVSDALPPADEMDPESCYLGFEIAFRSNAGKAEIESVFEFMGEDCRIRILPPNSWISEYVRLIQELPEDDARLGEILVRCGSVTAQELDAALSAQSESSPPQPIGTILVEQGSIREPVVEAALAKQEQVKAVRTQESRSIRVDADKLDQLINLIGELVIAGASTNLMARRGRTQEVQESASTLLNLVEQVRDQALQLRMVKIGATFSRFQRVVHDVAREIGKDIGLVIQGADTELDKTVVEKIADPLTHLVRNAIDHGIEPAEVRAARGKPARGTVTLNAYHDSGCIVIEVGDDGGGLKRERILAKAIERGLVEPGSSLSDSEIFNLVFEPGFSTAEQITNLSGRGVGMDVVKRNITALRGSVAIASEEGIGTIVTVRLPLTLAIIDGFLVSLGKAMFVVPLDMIEECVEFSAEQGNDYTNLRGEVLPFVRLREVFGCGEPPPRRESIVVVRYAGQKAGLVVDALHGEFQTVIKPLSKMFSQVKCISGSTILGSGEVALILDVPALVQQAGSAAQAVSKPHANLALAT